MGEELSTEEMSRELPFHLHGRCIIMMVQYMEMANSKVLKLVALSVLPSQP